MIRPTRLSRAFFRRPTLEVARSLLGKVLVHNTSAGSTAGIIMEVEAYIGEADPACHAASGLTTRNLPIYGLPGYAYVYLNYGMHYLLNAVTEPIGSPAAVLIREVRPLEGETLMRKRRGCGQSLRGNPVGASLCRGPGNLTRAFGITMNRNRSDLCGDQLYIEDRGLPAGRVECSSRIGISAGTDRQWRFLSTLDGVT